MDHANAAGRIEEVQGQEAVERQHRMDGWTCTRYSILVATLAFGGRFWDMESLEWLSRMKKVFQTKSRYHGILIDSIALLEFRILFEFDARP